jgi:hypothetical protein
MTNYHHNIIGSEALDRRAIVPGYGAVRLSPRRDGFWNSKTFALLLLLAVGAGVLAFALIRRGILIV